ncbi:alpha/beta fold hydrolase [Microbacterium sp. SS28]|uniref:alpha/beta fold hydrolase n=1 Tax=Microbacterium sp. SS28 TaxID=2919948 RepID=UPI001FAABEDE|nr:alpha/beta hydrolase [Microbacterium sp. SS28]
MNSVRRQTARWLVTVGSLTYRVLTDPGTEASGAPPIVLVHGIGMSHRYLSRLHDELAADGSVFSIDLPGYAGLPKPGEDGDVETMARGLGEVIASLGVGPVVLVGHSMGSQWVVEVGVQRPELVAHVVAMGPVVDDDHRSLFAQLRALVVDSLGEPPNVNAIVFTDYVRCGAPWYLAQVRHMLEYPIEDRAAALTMPLLVIRGGRDPIAGPAWCRRLRDRAARANLVVIPGHHHVAQHSAPRAVASAITAYTSPAGAHGLRVPERSLPRL